MGQKQSASSQAAAAATETKPTAKTEPNLRIIPPAPTATAVTAAPPPSQRAPKPKLPPSDEFFRCLQSGALGLALQVATDFPASIDASEQGSGVYRLHALCRLITDRDAHWESAKIVSLFRFIMANGGRDGLNRIVPSTHQTPFMLMTKHHPPLACAMLDLPPDDATGGALNLNVDYASEQLGGANAVFLAVQKHSQYCARILQRSTCRLNSIVHGRTPLVEAIVTGHVTALAELLRLQYVGEVDWRFKCTLDPTADEISSISEATGMLPPTASPGFGGGGGFGTSAYAATQRMMLPHEWISELANPLSLARRPKSPPVAVFREMGDVWHAASKAVSEWRDEIRCALTDECGVTAVLVPLVLAFLVLNC